MSRATRLAGLSDGVTAYTLRHTAATWLVSMGVPVWDTAQFLGTSPAMIERHYGHHAPDYLRSAAEAIGRKPGFGAPNGAPKRKRAARLA